jgi:hypothetical protein
MLERFLDRGVIVETGKDTYYLDLPEYDRWRRSIRRRLAFVVLGVSIAAAVLAAV